MNRCLLAVSLLWCGACLAPVGEGDLDASVMDASMGVEASDAGPDAGDAKFDKENGADGHPTQWPSAVDYTRLPFAIKIVPKAQQGWTTADSIWLYELCNGGDCGVGWGRDSRGSWYRNATNTPTHSYVFSAEASYTCEVGFLGGRCVSYVTGQVVNLTCPRTMQWSPYPTEWRSKYAGWPADQDGWFTWSVPAAASWGVNVDSRMEMRIHSVTTVPNRSRIACNYASIRPATWPWHDVFLYKR